MNRTAPHITTEKESNGFKYTSMKLGVEAVLLFFRLERGPNLEQRKRNVHLNGKKS